MDYNFTAIIISAGSVCSALLIIWTVVKKIADPISKLVRRVDELEKDTEKMASNLTKTNKQLIEATGDHKHASSVIMRSILSLIKRERTGDGEEFLSQAEQSIHDFLINK